MDYNKYVGYVVASITIILIGYWNPIFLQKRRAGKPNDCPNYVWLAIISLFVGCVYECLNIQI